MPPDGQCLLHAFAYHLQRPLQSILDSLAVSEAYLLKLRPWLQHSDITSYFAALQSGATWSDSTHILVACDVFEISVKVHTTWGTEHFGVHPNTLHLRLAIRSQAWHYDVLEGLREEAQLVCTPDSSFDTQTSDLLKPLTIQKKITHFCHHLQCFGL